MALPSAANVAVGGASVGQIQIDFGDGRGNQTIAPGAPLTIAFADTGVHRVQIRCSVSSSQVLETEVEIYLRQGYTVNPPSVTDWTNSPDVIIPILGSADHAGCILEIGFAVGNRPGTANPNLKVRNPLLVVEGIDFNDVAPHLAGGDFNYSNVIDDFNDFFLLGVTLANDRDIIVLNFNNSCESIERNAACFKDVIAWLNNPANRIAGLNLADHPTSVVGISMGGLVARLGLAQMVTASGGVDHTNVNLLFTQDSPHSGAQIPMALQVMTRTIIVGGTAALVGVGLSGSITAQALAIFGFTYIEELARLIDCDASDNMLLAKYKYSSFVFGAQYSNSWLQGYKNQVENVPGAQYRFVATSVGSECAQPQKAVAGRVLLELSLTSIFELDFGDFRLFSFASGGLFQLQGLPAENAGGKYVELKLWERIEILSFSGSSFFSRKHNLLDVNASVASNDGHHAWDFAPGGFMSLQSKGYSAGFDFNLGLFGVNFFRFSATSKRARGFGFISTASALHQNVYSDASLFTARNYLYNSPVSVPSTNARLASFSSEPPSGAEYNFQHPFFKARSARLLFAEVTGTPNNEAFCGLTCTPGAPIAGPLVICTTPGATIQESISSVYATGQIHWVVTNGIFTGQGTTLITIETPQPVGSEIAIDVVITMPNGCVIVGHKDVHIGLPYLNILSQSTSAYGGRKYVLGIPIGTELSAELAPNSPSVNCDLVTDFYPANVFNLSCGPTGGACNTNKFIVTASNVCGAITKDGFSVHCVQGNKARVNPQMAVMGVNPTISISLLDDQNALYESNFSGAVIDGRGMVVTKFSASSNPHVLDISPLKPAEYTVKLYNSDNEMSETTFILMKTGADRLIVSPNPIFKDVDMKVDVKILDTQTEDSEYEVTVDDWEGRRFLSFAATNREFPVDVLDLPIGSYIITATGANSSFVENLELVMRGTPYLWINPNPAISTLNGQVFNPLKEDMAYKVIITDKLGNEVRTFETSDNPFQTDISDLPADLYFIHVRNDMQQLSKIFRKL